MKTNLLLTAGLCLFISFQSFGQNAQLVVESERNEDKSISLSYEKNVFGTFHVSVWFTRLENAISHEINRDVSGSSGSLGTINPIDDSKHINYSYNYWYIRGKLKPKFDPDFVYLLPIGVNKTSEVVEMSNLHAKYFGAKPPKNWKSYLFNTKVDDTVYAARKGEIVLIDGDKDYNQKATVSYQSSVNRIMVEHQDGTLATYGGLHKNGIFVKEGDMVYPGDALGKIAQYDEREKGQLRFSVYYLDLITPGEEKPKAIKDKIQYYAYITPVFLTHDGAIQLEDRTTYSGVFDKNIFEMELSRRELKKLAKLKKQ